MQSAVQRALCREGKAKAMKESRYSKAVEILVAEDGPEPNAPNSSTDSIALPARTRPVSSVRDTPFISRGASEQAFNRTAGGIGDAARKWKHRSRTQPQRALRPDLVPANENRLLTINALFMAATRRSTAPTSWDLCRIRTLTSHRNAIGAG
jgi:hypothetical protein